MDKRFVKELPLSLRLALKAMPKEGLPIHIVADWLKEFAAGLGARTIYVENLLDSYKKVFAEPEIKSLYDLFCHEDICPLLLSLDEDKSVARQLLEKLDEVL